MAGSCDGRWTSTGRKDKTPNTEEKHGTIVVKQSAGNAVDVQLIPPGGSAPTARGRGTCTEGHGSGSSKPHILTFTLEVDGEPRIFRGIIDPSNPNKILCGSFIVRRGPPADGDTGLWQATKP